MVRGLLLFLGSGAFAHVLGGVEGRHDMLHRVPRTDAAQVAEPDGGGIHQQYQTLSLPEDLDEPELWPRADDSGIEDYEGYEYYLDYQGDGSALLRRDAGIPRCLDFKDFAKGNKKSIVDLDGDNSLLSKLSEKEQSALLARAESYALEEMPKFSKMLRFRTKLTNSMPKIRAALIQTKRITQKTLKALSDGISKAASIYGYITLHALIAHELKGGLDPQRLMAIARSMLPVLGCLERYADENGKPQLNFDTVICTIADVLLLTRLGAPLGMFLHIFQNFDAFKADVTDSVFGYIIVNPDEYTDDIYTEYSTQWYSRRAMLLEGVGSVNYTAYWVSQFEFQKADLVIEAADIAASRRAVYEEIADDVDFEEEDEQPSKESGSDTGSKEMEAQMCDILEEKKKLLLKDAENDINQLFEERYDRFHAEFNDQLRERARKWEFTHVRISSANQRLREKYDRGHNRGYAPGPGHETFTNLYMNYLQNMLPTCQTSEPPVPETFKFPYWSGSGLKSFRESIDGRGYEKGSEPCGEDMIHISLQNDIQREFSVQTWDKLTEFLNGKLNPHQDVCICRVANTSYVGNKCRRIFHGKQRSH